MDISGLLFNGQVCPSDETYFHFNQFIFSNDIRILGKLLHRHDFLKRTFDLPGDIVEVGVFKGSGISTWCKLLDIFCHHTNKKVIGFDLFQSQETDSTLSEYVNGSLMNTVYKRSTPSELSLDSVHRRLSTAGIQQNKYILVQGDCSKTTRTFVNENPGFRISILYIDLDLNEPTYYTLVNLWDRIVPGGVVVFDEYEFHKFDESNGADRFFKERNITYEIKTTHFYGPTAFIVKS